MARRNAPEGRATISFSKLRHSWGALASTRAWDVSGRTPVCTRVRRPLRGALATSLPPSTGERKWGTRGRGDSKADSDRVHSATSSHPQPAERSRCRPRGRCCPLHPRTQSGGHGGPRGGPGGSQGVEVPRSEFAASSRRRRHLNPILPAAAPPSPACQQPGSRQRSVAGSPGCSPRESGRPGADVSGSTTRSWSSVPSPTHLGCSCQRLRATARRGLLHPRPLTLASGACTAASEPEVRRPEVRGLGPGIASLLWLSPEAEPGAATSRWCARVSPGAGSSRLRPGLRPG